MSDIVDKALIDALQEKIVSLNERLEKANRLISIASSVFSEDDVNEAANCHAVFASFLDERQEYFEMIRGEND